MIESKKTTSFEVVKIASFEGPMILRVDKQKKMEFAPAQWLAVPIQLPSSDSRSLVDQLGNRPKSILAIPTNVCLIDQFWIRAWILFCFFAY